MTEQRKTNAECLRLALVAGLVAPGDVIRWADHEIEGESKPSSQLIEVACSPQDSVKEVAHLLREIPGVIEPEIVTNRFLALAMQALDADPHGFVPLIRALKRTHPDEALTPSAAAAIDRLDDALYLAESEAYGTLETVRAELREFLSAYRAWEPEIPVIGRIP